LILLLVVLVSFLAVESEFVLVTTTPIVYYENY